MLEKISKIISLVFHPVLIPTLGMFLLFHSGFYYSMLNWELKRYILLVVFFTTGILPLLSVAILALNPKFDMAMPKSRDRIIPLISASVFYYFGTILLGKLKAYPIFKIFLLASVLVLVVLLIVSLWWKISMHMASAGGLTGALLAVCFKTGANPVLIILFVILVSGIVGSARLVLKKHTFPELLAGYFLGVTTLYLVIYFS